MGILRISVMTDVQKTNTKKISSIEDALPLYAPPPVEYTGKMGAEVEMPLMKPGKGKPAIPTLIEGARSHDAETHRICAFFLRKHTGITLPNLIHFENWWTANRKTVQDDEKTWWDEQAKKGWTVAPDTFATYDLPMESIVP